MIWRLILIWWLGTWLALANVPSRIANIFTVNLPSTVSLQYDGNGNLTNDGTRSFFYDAENRLTNVNVTAAWKTEFIYDGLGRRRVERDYAWQSSAWTRTNETRFIFDGLLPIQERDTNNSPLVSYTRGIDLGGGFQSAGGIGGLLARTDANGSTYYHADGVGNITALMDSRENILNRYLYDAFGRMLGQWGTNGNTMGFSSMPRLGASGLIAYSFRLYDPVLMRWLNHDPIGVAGGVNLYGFVGNNALNRTDPFGLQQIELDLKLDVQIPETPGTIYPRGTAPSEEIDKEETELLNNRGQAQEIKSSDPSKPSPDDEPSEYLRKHPMVKPPTQKCPPKPTTLYHGTSTSNARSILNGGFKPGEDGAVFFGNDFATASHFGLEALAESRDASATVLRFTVPQDLAENLGLNTSLTLGEFRGASPIDIPFSSGTESVLIGPNITSFNQALGSGTITVKPLTLRAD